MVELAEILRRAGPAYAAAHPGQLLPSHRRAMADLCACRTAALGGSLVACNQCDHLDFLYHSCRNRHCPKCAKHPTERWLQRLAARLLPCEYVFATFTLPAELRDLARAHQRLVYDLLLREAACSLQTLADDPRFVGATLGILAVLHTWARDLSYHPHVHLLVTAGGLTADGTTWRKSANATFLVPGYALSTIFRAKVRDAIAKAGLASRVDPRVFRKPWTVHLQHAGRGDHAAAYLSRYVHRVAISNDRIERFDGRCVTFRYVSTRDHQTKRLALDVDSFLARFLQHVLPRGFVKIRNYGLFSPAARKQQERARAILTAYRSAIDRPVSPPSEQSLPLTHRPCPACAIGHLHRQQTWRPGSIHVPLLPAAVAATARPPP